jgi:hypothetical protein
METDKTEKDPTPQQQQSPPKKKPKKKKKKKAGKTKAQDTAAVVVMDQKDFRQDLESLGDIDPKSLENLNTDDLRKKMVTGIYLLEHCLFSQAGFEFARVQSLRTLLKQLEDDIFKPEVMKALSEGERLRLYRMCMNNMAGSLEFLSNLHKNVTLGIEAVNNIDRMKADRNLGPVPLANNQQSTDVSAIRQQILDEIAIKSAPAQPKAKKK